MCRRGGDVVGDALQHREVRRDRRVEHAAHVVPGGLEPVDPRGIDQVRIQREIELDVSRARGDRVRHQRAFDLDRVRHERLERGVAARLGTDHRRQRMSEDRRGRERHLERIPAGGVDHERRLARARGVDGTQATDDLVDVQPHVLAAVVAERDRLPGPHAVHRVVERVHEHPSPELAVGDDVQAAVDLSLDRRSDRVVLDRGQLRPIAVALLGERGRMPRLVERVDRGAQLRRPQQRADGLRARGAAWRSRPPSCVETPAPCAPPPGR